MPENDFGILVLKGKITKVRKKQIFNRNSARNYFSATKFQLKNLDFNTKKTTFGDFGIFHFKGEEGGKSLNFEKFRFLNVTGLQFTAV